MIFSQCLYAFSALSLFKLNEYFMLLIKKKKSQLCFSLSKIFSASRTPSTLFLFHVSNQKVWYSLNSLLLSYIKAQKSHMVENPAAEASRSGQQQGRSAAATTVAELTTAMVADTVGLA